MALGADAGEVRGMIVKQGMRLVLFGSCAGIGLAVGGVEVVRGLLFGSAGGDWLIYSTAVSLIACTGLLACWFPAQRGARTTPLNALREE
jgi:ABC-type antimicrobial peptide transport system permease subunit